MNVGILSGFKVFFYGRPDKTGKVDWNGIAYHVAWHICRTARFETSKQSLANFPSFISIFGVLGGF